MNPAFIFYVIKGTKRVYYVIFIKKSFLFEFVYDFLTTLTPAAYGPLKKNASMHLFFHQSL